MPDIVVEAVLDFLLFLQGQQSQKDNTENGETRQLPEPSVLDRMGGVPKHLLFVGNLSEIRGKLRLQLERVFYPLL
jgi:hypothetical protein